MRRRLAVAYSAAAPDGQLPRLLHCYLGDEVAAHTLLEQLEGPPLGEPRFLRFVTGRRHQFWRHTREMPIPETLQYKIDHFRSSGHTVAEPLELFQNPNWLAVLLGQEVGQEVMPECCDPLADMRGDVDASGRQASLRRMIGEAVRIMPTHRQ